MGSHQKSVYNMPSAPPDYATVVGEPPPQYAPPQMITMVPAAPAYQPHVHQQPRRPYADSRIPQLSACCCGCSLKTGVKLIGWLSATIATIRCAFLAVALALAPSLRRELENNSTANNMSYEDRKELQKQLEHINFGTLGPHFFIFFFEIVLGVMLLVGVYKGVQSYVKAWVQVKAAFLTIFFFFIIFEFLFTAFNPGRSSITSDIITFLLGTYFVLVVFSYYREVEYKKLTGRFQRDPIS